MKKMKHGEKEKVARRQNGKNAREGIQGAGKEKKREVEVKEIDGQDVKKGKERGKVKGMKIVLWEWVNGGGKNVAVTIA